MKKRTKTVAIIMIVLSIFLVITNFILSEENYKRNKTLSYSTNSEGYITWQGSLVDFSFGFGNLSDNGCGAVALYNILKMKNKEMPLADITHIIEPFGAQFFGLLGTSPLIMKWFLESKGLECSFVTNRAKFEQAIAENEIVIYVYYSLKGGHYQLIYDYDQTTNTIKTLNPIGYHHFSDIYDDSLCYSKFMLTIR